MNRSKDKKIAIVSDSIYPFNKGGKEKRLYDITNHLAAQGYDVTIYCMKWWDGPQTIQENGVTLHAISPYYPLYHNDRRSIKEGILFALHCLKLVWEPFDVIEVDHIPHLVLFTTKIVCILRQKKMIVTWHEVWGKKYWQKYLGTVKGYIAYMIERASVRLPDTIVSVSDHTTKRLRRTLHVEKNVITIPNGLNMEMITTAGSSRHSSDVMYVGRLLEHKNIDVLLRAVAILKEKKPNVSAVIVGEGPEKENLENLAVELGLESNVSFFGFIESHLELYRIMRASRVFVLPSTREGFGIAVIEANACGLPAITIDDRHNGARELIIPEENGVLCELDEHALAAAIEKTLVTRKGTEFYRKYAEKYSWNAIFPRIVSVYFF